jgi:hypothetical protein
MSGRWAAAVISEPAIPVPSKVMLQTYSSVWDSAHTWGSGELPRKGLYSPGFPPYPVWAGHTRTGSRSGRSRCLWGHTLILVPAYSLLGKAHASGCPWYGMCVWTHMRWCACGKKGRESSQTLIPQIPDKEVCFWIKQFLPRCWWLWIGNTYFY